MSPCACRDPSAAPSPRSLLTADHRRQLLLSPVPQAPCGHAWTQSSVSSRCLPSSSLSWSLSAAGPGGHQQPGRGTGQVAAEPSRESRRGQEEALGSGGPGGTQKRHPGQWVPPVPPRAASPRGLRLLQEPAALFSPAPVPCQPREHKGTDVSESPQLPQLPLSRAALLLAAEWGERPPEALGVVLLRTDKGCGSGLWL